MNPPEWPQQDQSMWSQAGAFEIVLLIAGGVLTLSLLIFFFVMLTRREN